MLVHRLRLLTSHSQFCGVIAGLACFHFSMRAQGVVQWVKVGGTSQYESLSRAVLGPNGEIFLAGQFGYTDSPNLSEAVLFKYNSNGEQVASQACRGESATGFAVESGGNYYLGGSVSNPDLLGKARQYDFYLGKYAADGSLQWEYTAGTPNDRERSRTTDGQSGDQIALDNAGNIYVAGMSYGAAVYGTKTFPDKVGGPSLCKFAPDGTLLWVRRAEGARRFAFGSLIPAGSTSALALDAEGNAIIAGQITKGTANFDGTLVNIFGSYDYGAFVAKYSATGEIIWAKAVPFGETTVDPRGNVFINGLLANGAAILDGVSVQVDDPLHRNAFVAKYDPSGALLWAKAALTGGLKADRSGNVLSGGSKLDPSGNVLWEITATGLTLSLATLNGEEEPVFTGTVKGTVTLNGQVIKGDSDKYDDYVICKADTNGKLQWAATATSGDSPSGLSEGPFGYGIGSVLADRDGGIFVFGTVRCPYSFQEQTYICDVAGKFGDFPVSVQLGGNNDLFLARIEDSIWALPELKIARTASGVALSWSVAITGFILEATDSLPAITWTAVSEVPRLEGNENIVTVDANIHTRFFRLKKL